MDFIRRYPATAFLIVANSLVFIVCYYVAKTFSDPEWALTLLRFGAEFNPLTLDREWYRIFAHMFLHGHIMHLAFNIYALFSIGSVLEPEVGTKKFIGVYLITGVAAALNSLYWNLFTIGVGASGAIFGLFGFSVVLNVFNSSKQGRPIVPILINFGIFLVINLLFAKALHADNSAHLGGLVTGAILAGVFVLSPDSDFKAEYIFAFLLVGVYFLLPRYQVHYYHFFGKVLAQEDSAKMLFVGRNLSDDQFARRLKNQNTEWNNVLKSLDSIEYLPAELHLDTFKLRHYIRWRKIENDYRYTMVERESYIYLDSIEYADSQIIQYLSLDHIPPRLGQSLAAPAEQPARDEPLEQVQVWYDQNWEELPSAPGKFYRIGARDSVGQWQGKVKDFYANGDVQMKGGFRNNSRDGVFIYYSNHHTYEAAGRYRDDRRVGKWENYHNNGKIESEEYYRDGYFLKSYWDSSGVQQIKNGFGRVIKKNSAGLTIEEGAVRDGKQQDLWVGHYPNGELFFEEYYINGRLIRGRSQDPQGKNFVYDATSYYPSPEIGRQKMEIYLHTEAQKMNTKIEGSVKLSFRVMPSGNIVDVRAEKSLSKELDEKAKDILLRGPHWLPAHDHGFVAIDGPGTVSIDFGKNKQ
jgi:membrane associated rhomboid family serine protease/antitoxin component YwqK of YwqJK toxin-antitoxin module